MTPDPPLLVADPIFPPAPWPEVQLPGGKPARSAFADADGVRVRITLDRNPLVAGQPTWITTELINTGRDKILWTEDGCGIHVGVSGRLLGLRWPAGAEQPGLAGKFKQSAWRNMQLAEDLTISLDFVPEWAVGIGEFGCADIAFGKELRPGRKLVSRLRWDGLMFQRAGLPPSSAAEITGTFSRGWGRAGEGANARRNEIVARLPAWIQGVDGPKILSVGEAVDVALTHDGFAEWVKRTYQGVSVWQSITVLDPKTGVWQIGLSQYPGGETRIIVVDSATGTTGQFLRAKTDGGGGFRILGPADS